MRIRSPRDFWSGVIFIVSGLFIAIYAYTHYQLGSSLRMGPGYFPVWLGSLTFVLGAIVFGRSFVLEGPPVETFHWRPMVFILGACILYGYILKPVGLVVATVMLTVVSAFGGHEFKWKEVTVLAIVMVIFSIVIFVWGLKLPFPLWPEAFQ
jgi:hypothetical protein